MVKRMGRTLILLYAYKCLTEQIQNRPEGLKIACGRVNGLLKNLHQDFVHNLRLKILFLLLKKVIYLLFMIIKRRVRKVYGMPSMS